MGEKVQFDLSENVYYKKSQFNTADLRCDKEFWNIGETISELAYLTHDYFRYYGKFPSKVGKMIIEELISKKAINPVDDFIIDNYAGSGTTLVESKLLGFDSIGLDINPFAVLACRVKTYNYDTKLLRSMWARISREILKYDSLKKEGLLECLYADIDEEKKLRINKQTELMKGNEAYTKWFSELTLYQLQVIKDTLLEYEVSREREFFDLGFFAIIRRVSYAHDAEVRPHVNKKKRKRDVIEAYSKKINEMLDTMDEWNLATTKEIYANAYVSSNADEKRFDRIVKKEKSFTGKSLGAVVSHPPYLNCFDYISVYKLKFMWAEGFSEIFDEMSYDEIKKAEIKSYPVNNEQAINKYFEHNYAVYRNVYNNLREGGYCCIVIGDCTVKKQLFSVHKSFITMMQEIGFSLEKMAYRSTAYGMGKYAYNFRADYSEDKDSKQDAILFFRK